MSIYPNYNEIPEEYKRYMDDEPNSKIKIKFPKIPSVNRMKIVDIMLAFLFLNIMLILGTYLINKFDLGFMDWLIMFAIYKFAVSGSNLLFKTLTHNYEVERERMKNAYNELQKKIKKRSQK